MATILTLATKDGSARYKAIIRIKGHPTQIKHFKRLTDAKAWVRKEEGEISSGKVSSAPESKRRTFAEMVDRYKKSVVPHRHKKVLAKRAITCHLEWWKANLGPYFIADVTPAKIGELRDKLLASPRLDSNGDAIKAREGSASTKSPATVVRYLASLSVMYTTAVDEWGWAEKNPVQAIRRPIEPRGRIRFLTDKEREKLLECCRKTSEVPLYEIVVLALSTGARQGELLSLTWDQIDFERNVIRLEITKNNERRGLPLVGHAHEAMSNYKERRRLDTDLVFPRQDGKAPVDLRKPWKRLMKATGLADFRFHDLRHCAASALAMNGATLAEIAEVLGHKTLQMVKRYAHISDQHTAKVVERMNKNIFGKKVKKNNSP